MPNGKVHGAIGVTVAVTLEIAGVGMLAMGAPVEWGQLGALGVGLVLGILITPDMDIDHRTEEEKRFFEWPKKVLGKTLGTPVGWVLGTIWMLLWLPYAWIMPHRSKLSHWPVLGTLIRAGWLLVLAWAAGYTPRVDGYSLLVLAGWALQDMAHAIADKMIKSKEA